MSSSTEFTDLFNEMQGLKGLALAIIGQAFLDLLDDFKKAHLRDERRRLRYQEEANYFLSGPDAEPWCEVANVPNELIRVAATRLRRADAEVRQAVRDLVQDVFVQSRNGEGREGAGDGTAHEDVDDMEGEE